MAVMTMTPATQGAAVHVWDGPTRLFHWLLVILIISAWISYRYAEVLGDARLVWHRSNGLTILVLVIWRVLWGFAGSSTSRFSTFVRGPAKAMAYGRAVRAGTNIKFLGHNPLGAWMIVAMLTALVVQASLGLFAIDDNDMVGGPLIRLVSTATRKQMTGLHGWNFFYVLLTLIAVHIAAALFHHFIRKDGVLRRMLPKKG